jgi:hypothetical protein
VAGRCGTGRERHVDAASIFQTSAPPALDLGPALGVEHRCAAHGWTAGQQQSGIRRHPHYRERPRVLRGARGDSEGHLDGSVTTFTHTRSGPSSTPHLRALLPQPPGLGDWRSRLRVSRSGLSSLTTPGRYRRTVAARDPCSLASQDSHAFSPWLQRAHPFSARCNPACTFGPARGVGISWSLTPEPVFGAACGRCLNPSR